MFQTIRPGQLFLHEPPSFRDGRLFGHKGNLLLYHVGKTITLDQPVNNPVYISPRDNKDFYEVKPIEEVVLGNARLIDLSAPGIRDFSLFEVRNRFCLVSSYTQETLLLKEVMDLTGFFDSALFYSLGES